MKMKNQSELLALNYYLTDRIFSVSLDERTERNTIYCLL
jgi:hypothetical protein